METNAFHAAGGTLITGYPASLRAILLGKNLAGWHIECREAEDLSYAHGFLMTHGTHSIITLSADLSEAEKIQGVRFLLNRLSDTPLKTSDTFLWHVGDVDEVEQGDATYDRVQILDTTLRNGAETPGITLSLHQKIELAQQVARLNVDILEAGFPERSPADAVAVRKIAQAVGKPDGPRIAALAGVKRTSIDAAWAALQPASKRRLHIFISTSRIHIERQMESTYEEVLNKAREAVLYARSLCDDIQFSAMDASRSEPDFLYQVLETVIAAGATTINIPDTVGIHTPNEYGALIANIRRHVHGVEHVILSTHCHNDMGMAVANTLAGVQAGARQVECTINGIGERAGNAPLEEVVMALKTRLDVYGVKTFVHIKELARVSRAVRDITDVPLPLHKPIVGEGITMHKKGIHFDGWMKDRKTFEIISPSDVGLDTTMPYSLLDSKSTYADFRRKLLTLGYELNLEQASQFFVSFKEIAASKKVISDAEINALLKQAAQRPQEIYTLEQLNVNCGLNIMPSATVILQHKSGTTHRGQAFGSGPIDAVYKAVNSIVAQENELFKFTINAITEGVDSAAEVSVRVRVIRSSTETGVVEDEQEQEVYEGYGVHPDTVVAATYAYMNVMNRILATRPEHNEHKRFQSAAPGSRDDASSGSDKGALGNRKN